jgi:hypothetical protein
VGWGGGLLGSTFVSEKEIRELRDAVREVREVLGRGGGMGEAVVVAALTGSVLRPLDQLVGAVLAAPGGSGSGVPAASLWQLALRATGLRARPDVPVQLIEATAALQALACTEDGLGQEEATARLEELRRLQTGVESRPLRVLVSGAGVAGSAVASG